MWGTWQHSSITRSLSSSSFCLRDACEAFQFFHPFIRCLTCSEHCSAYDPFPINKFQTSCHIRFCAGTTVRQQGELILPNSALWARPRSPSLRELIYILGKAWPSHWKEMISFLQHREICCSVENGVYLIRQNIPSELSWNEHCPGHLVLLESCVISNVKETPQSPGPQVLWSQRVSETRWHSASAVCWSFRMRQCASRAGELSSLELGLGIERSWCWNYFGLDFFFLSFVPLIIIISGTERVKKMVIFLVNSVILTKMITIFGTLAGKFNKRCWSLVSEWLGNTHCVGNGCRCRYTDRILCPVFPPQPPISVSSNSFHCCWMHIALFSLAKGKHILRLCSAVLCKGGVPEQGAWVPAWGKML